MNGLVYGMLLGQWVVNVLWYCHGSIICGGFGYHIVVVGVVGCWCGDYGVYFGDCS